MTHPGPHEDFDSGTAAWNEDTSHLDWDLAEVLDPVYPGWREAGRGQLADWLAAETRDVMMITAEVSKAYLDLTGGLISKPNTLADHVIAAVEEHFDKYMIDRDQVDQLVTRLTDEREIYRNAQIGTENELNRLLKLRPTCPTCGGTPWITDERTGYGVHDGRPCPDCPDGKMPFERMVAIIADETIDLPYIQGTDSR